MTSSSISSSSTSLSFPWIVAALALLAALDILEAMVGEVGNQLGTPEPLPGEDGPANFLDK